MVHQALCEARKEAGVCLCEPCIRPDFVASDTLYRFEQVGMYVLRTMYMMHVLDTYVLRMLPYVRNRTRRQRGLSVFLMTCLSLCQEPRYYVARRQELHV